MKRSELEEYVDVMDCCSELEGAKITRLVRDANLNYNRLRPKLDRLISKGLVYVDSKSYCLTQEGFAFIRIIKKAITVLREE